MPRDSFEMKFMHTYQILVITRIIQGTANWELYCTEKLLSCKHGKLAKPSSTSRSGYVMEVAGAVIEELA